MADYKSEKPENKFDKQNKTEKKSKFNFNKVRDEQEPSEFISDKKVTPETSVSEDWEESQPIKNKKEEKVPVQKIKGSYRIILVSPSYIVISNNGNNQFVNGDFKGKKIGDEIELKLP